MDNEQKRIKKYMGINPNEPQDLTATSLGQMPSGLDLTYNYITPHKIDATAPRNYNLTTNAIIPQLLASQGDMSVPKKESCMEVVCPVGHDLLNQIRAVVREELQREQSHNRSGTVHICIDGQWYQGDLYPTDEEAHG